jgi:hypothetical protein
MAHVHFPPHGGTSVELGEHEFQLELVVDRTAGKIQAYMLDAHMENFVRINAEFFEVHANASGAEHVLTFRPVASTATGERAGDTSLFEVQADWIRTADSITGVLKELTIRGKKFTNIAFAIGQRRGNAQ